MIAFIVISIAVAMALIGTPVIRIMGVQLEWVDQPGKRKVHQTPIVRVGGIAICVATLIATAIGIELLKLSPVFLPMLPMIGLVLGSLGFFAIGLADDIFHLSAGLRLVLQACVTVLVWFLGVRVEFLPVPLIGTVALGLWSLPISFLWLAGVANAINWLDGLDGLAGGVSTIAAFTLAILCWPQHPDIALFAFALAGASLGFLRYNANPAQIFMGDGGSYLIGFVLAGTSAIGLMQNPQFLSTLLPFWILAVAIGDMLLVIAGRLRDGKSPFFPDQRHLHHRLLQAGLPVRSAVQWIWYLSSWVASSALAIAGVPYGMALLFLTSALLIWSSYPLWKRSRPSQMTAAIKRLPTIPPFPQL